MKSTTLSSTSTYALSIYSSVHLPLHPSAYINMSIIFLSFHPSIQISVPIHPSYPTTPKNPTTPKQKLHHTPKNLQSKLQTSQRSQECLGFDVHQLSSSLQSLQRQVQREQALQNEHNDDFNHLCSTINERNTCVLCPPPLS